MNEKKDTNPNAKSRSLTRLRVGELVNCDFRILSSFLISDFDIVFTNQNAISNKFYFKSSYLIISK